MRSNALRTRDFATPETPVATPVPKPTLLVVDPAQLSPALLADLLERGAMRITVPVQR